MDRIVMRKSSMINLCKHYDDIVEYIYNEDDRLAKMFIDYYRDYMDAVNLDSSEDVNLIYEYDEALYSYLTNRKFYRLVQEQYNNKNDWGNFMIQNLIQLYAVYQDMISCKVKEAKWL